MALSILFLAAGCASAAPPLWPHPMRDGANGAPGDYATYDFEQREASPDMEVEIIWTTIPSDSDTDGNGVFASSQYWHESYTGAINTAGYMGSQVMRSGNGTEKRVFIFSCWDADSSRPVSWDSDTNNCGRFGGEGVGSHCVLEFPIQEGVQYNFRYAMSKHDSAGAHWTGTVLDTSTGKSHVVGTLVYPDLDGYTGFGNLQFHTDDFLEYFSGGDCEGAATTGVGIRGPYFHGKTSTAYQAYPSYNSADQCERSVVDRCIPGQSDMCGKPNVHLGGGKGIVRDTSNGQPLWTSSLDRVV